MKKSYLMLVFALLLSSLASYNAAHAYGLPKPPSIILNIQVYITDDDKEFFHRSVCGLLYGKKTTRIALGKAYKEGYMPCGHCRPPQIGE